MIRKIIKIMLLIFVLVYVNIDIVEAAKIGLDSNKILWDSTGSSTPEEPTITDKNETIKTEGTYYGKKTTKVTEYCQYQTAASTSINTYIDIYDKKIDDGKTTLTPNNFDFPNKYQAVAGMALGVKIVDKRVVGWQIKPKDIKYVKIVETKEEHDGWYEYDYTCHYEKESKGPRGTSSSIPNPNNQIPINDLSNRIEKIDIKQMYDAVIIDWCEDIEDVEDSNECRLKTPSGCKFVGYTENETYHPGKTNSYSSIYTNDEKNDAAKIKKCRESAVEATLKEANGQINWGAAYTVNLTNSNDINGENVTLRADEVSKQSWECYKPSDDKNTPDTPIKNDQCKFGGNEIENYKTKIVEEIKKKYNRSVIDVDFALEDNIYIKMPYTKKYTCIDKKTGFVSYVPGKDQNGRTKTKCDPQTEFEIEKSTDSEGDEYWYYFIPLNAKNNGSVEISTMSNWDSTNYDGTMTEAKCKEYLETYMVKPDDPDAFIYTDIVVLYDKATKTVKNFKGDYKGIKDASSYDWTILDEMKDSDEIEDRACRLASKITIPIKQIFYNEVTEQDQTTKKDIVKFNGFNFFYKPIDVSSATKDNQVDIVFPNGVSKNILTGELKTVTLWDDWYKNQTQKGVPDKAKTPDLSESFAAATYLASAINAKEIREYNKDNAYTNWSKMNYDGTSKYISNDDIIKRLTGATDNIYPLGCGPLNVNEYLQDEHGNTLYDANRNPIKNIWYIKGCDKP